MKRFLLQLHIFLLPLAVLVALELFVLPIDFFTFRVWESLYVRHLRGLLPGPFYPGMTVAKEEQGDLAPYTPYALKKNVVWQTDRFGFRQEERGDSTRWPVIIVGDSYIVGPGLTQADMVGPALERRLGQNVYSYAPCYDIHQFLAEKRFQARPPSVLIYAVTERWAPSQPHVHPPPVQTADAASRWMTPILENATFQHGMILIDRLFKSAMLKYLKGRSRAFGQRWFGIQSPDKHCIGPLFFLEGEQANRPCSDADVRRAIAVFCGYRDYFEAQGIRFVFVGIPNKENIYHDLFPAFEKPTLLSRLFQGLRAAGVEVVDLQAAFDAAQARGETLFFADDTHWTPHGANLVADEIARALAMPGHDAK